MIKNIEDWKKLLKQKNSDNGNLLYEIANYFDDGLEIDGNIIVEENKKEAFELYEKASKNGSIESKIRLADFYSEGVICEKNIDLAIDLYSSCIELGFGMAAHNLATVYRDLGNYSKAFQLYKTSQNLDKTNSIELAYCYYFGIGTDINKMQAFDIFEKIANDDSVNSNCEYEVEDANYYLGLYYLEGIFVDKSINRARELFERANIDNDHRNANEILLLIGRSNDENIKSGY
uniref:tetratricopeptide repeat protein n=1 Tax=Flavobacterium sp. TaxID=239 RepID=UPI00404A34FF